MFDERSTEARLSRLFKQPRGAAPANARELEAELMDAFDRRYPRKEPTRMMSLTTRRALILCAAACALGVVAACTAPVDLDVEVGRTVQIRYAEAGHPAPREIAAFLQSTLAEEGKAANRGAERVHREVGLRVKKEAGAVFVDAEIWGDGPPPGELAGSLKEKFPQLADAHINEELLHGKVKGTLAKKFGHDVLNLDVLSTDDVETARQKVLAQLHAQGIDGKVDVQIEGSGGERKVMIRVERECPDGGPPDEVPPETP